MQLPVAEGIGTHEVTLCTPVAVDRPAAAILTADVLRGRGVVVIAGTNCAVRIESSVLGANRGIGRVADARRARRMGVEDARVNIIVVVGRQLWEAASRRDEG